MKPCLRLPSLLLLLLSVFAYPAQKPAIAIIELSGHGLDSADLGAMTNRLRAELFETEKYTVVERSQMETILKEQGFQQTGCTDASCAVQIGQLLNAQFIILGAIDHVGRVFSVNIRMVNVENGEISSSAKSDCADCTIEDVMLKEIRSAARKIAGVDTANQTDVVTEQKGRKLIKYKNYKGGEAGSLMISGIPQNGEVLIDSISHGNRNMVIDYVPVGRHLVCIKYGKKGILKEKVVIGYGKTTEFDYVAIQNRRYHFCIEPGVAIAFPLIKNKDYRNKFMNENNPNDTITAPNGDFKWLPLMPALSFTWINQKNAIGFTLGGIITKKQITKTDSAGNEFVFDFGKYFLGLFFTYYRTILSVDDYFKWELGFLAAGSYGGMKVNPAYGIAKTTQERYSALPWYQDINGNTYNEDNGEYDQRMIGGPSMVINAMLPFKFIYLKLVYSFLLGMNNQASPTPGAFNNPGSTTWGFAMHNMLGANIVFKF